MNNTRSTGSILAIAGGIGLVITSFLTWVTVTLNTPKFAAALGIDPTLIPPGSMPAVSEAVKGTDDWWGAVAIGAGIVAIVVAVIALLERLGVYGPAELAALESFHHPVLINAAGRRVGRIEAVVHEAVALPE